MHLCTTFILLLILLLMLSLSCILYALLVQWELSYISTRSSTSPPDTMKCKIAACNRAFISCGLSDVFDKSIDIYMQVFW